MHPAVTRAIWNATIGNSACNYASPSCWLREEQIPEVMHRWPPPVLISSAMLFRFRCQGQFAVQDLETRCANWNKPGFPSWPHGRRFKADAQSF